MAHPHLAFEFCKGYYARVTDRMHGRVTRLFITPLIRSMLDMAPGAPFLRFLDSFRYALAGEFAMDINLARVNRIPADWGLEVGVHGGGLSELRGFQGVPGGPDGQLRTQAPASPLMMRPKGLARMAERHRQVAVPHARGGGLGLHGGPFPQPGSALRPDGPGYDRALLRGRHAERPQVRPQRGGTGGCGVRQKPACAPRTSSSRTRWDYPSFPTGTGCCPRSRNSSICLQDAVETGRPRQMTGQAA